MRRARSSAALKGARGGGQRAPGVRALSRGVRRPALRALAGRGAHLQRPLWASTSTKNPAYPDTLYVDELIGADTVNTMPLATLQAFNDHGALESRIERDLDSARALFRRLPELGVPLDALIAQLEGEGVDAFAQSYDALLESLESRRAALSGKSAS